MKRRKALKARRPNSCQNRRKIDDFGFMGPSRKDCWKTGVPLGTPWGPHGASSGLQKLSRSHLRRATTHDGDGDGGGFWGGVLEASWNPVGGSLKAVFRPPGACSSLLEAFGVSRGPLGAEGSRLQLGFSHLGPLLDTSRGSLGRSMAPLGLSWRFFGRLGALVGVSWAVLGASCAILDAVKGQ